jgi:hypothetical protein
MFLAPPQPAALRPRSDPNGASQVPGEIGLPGRRLGEPGRSEELGGSVLAGSLSLAKSCRNRRSASAASESVREMVLTSGHGFSHARNRRKINAALAAEVSIPNAHAANLCEKWILRQGMASAMP